MFISAKRKDVIQIVVLVGGFRVEDRGRSQCRWGDFNLVYDFATAKEEIVFWCVRFNECELRKTREIVRVEEARPTHASREETIVAESEILGVRRARSMSEGDTSRPDGEVKGEAIGRTTPDVGAQLLEFGEAFNVQQDRFSDPGMENSGIAPAVAARLPFTECPLDCPVGDAGEN